MIALTALATGALVMSCEVQPPQTVWFNEDGVHSNAIGLPPEMDHWTFDLTIDAGEDRDTKLLWKGDPIRVGNTTPAIPIGDNAFSFLSIHFGPCLFTETACMFMYTVTVHDDGTASLLIQPSAISTDESGRREPFQVYMSGECKLKGAAQ